MTSPGAVRRMVLVALVIAATAPAALAQSQGDIRRESERLQAQVDDLVGELEAAKKSIQDLQEENSRLRAALNNARQGGGGEIAPPEEEKVTIDESKPDASPRALFNALRREHTETAADLEMGASAGDPARVAFLRQLRRWVAKANREYKIQIDWNVRVVAPAIPVGRGFVLRLQAVDPVTHTELGDPFDALLNRSLAARLQNRSRRLGLNDVMLLKGVMLPRVHVNEDRTEEGPFDNPRFLGAFTEFGMTVEAQSLVAAPDPEEEQATSNDNGT